MSNALISEVETMDKKKEKLMKSVEKNEVSRDKAKEIVKQLIYYDEHVAVKWHAITSYRELADGRELFDMLTQEKKGIGIYPGQYYDQESDFHYNYYRYYQPYIGRYLTCC